nr:hypothetical protein [uncultured archaeon]
MNAITPMNGQIVLVGVCTHKRPQMLRDCLDSLTQQLIPSNISAAIVVVDNEPVPAADTIVDEFVNISPIPLYYVHEPRRGIACARNAVLDTATSMCADWIAFIDDDEIAEQDWLANLMAPEYLDTAVLQGRREFIESPSGDFWAIPKRKKSKREGAIRYAASTCNVRFSTKIVQAGIRFDEAIGLGSGEDVDFFARATAMGFKIIYTNNALTHERRHPERQTFFAQMYREICSGANSGRKAKKIGGTGAALRAFLGSLVISPVGLLEIVAAPLFLAGGMTLFKRRMLSGGKKIAKAIGRGAALLGALPRPYLHTVGH